jgi:hypothetical protein
VAAGTNNVGVRGEGIGNGAGCSCLGGATGPGGQFTAGGGNAAGAEGTGDGTGAGFDGTGGAFGAGVRGTAGGPAADGGFFDSDLSGTTAGTGCTGRGRGDATGVLGTAADGYGVVASSDTTSPTRSALRIVPQNADPTTLADGDVWVNSSTEELSVRQSSVTTRVVVRRDGQCEGFSSNASTVTDNASTFTTVIAVVVSAPRTGTVRITLTGEVGRDAAGSIDVRCRDVTAGANAVTTRNVALFQSAVFERHFVIRATYVLPATGSRTFELQIASNGSAGGNVSIRDGSIEIDGIYP